MTVWQTRNPLLPGVMADRSTKPWHSTQGPHMRDISFLKVSHCIQIHSPTIILSLFQHINCQVIIIYLGVGLMHIHDTVLSERHLNLKSVLRTKEKLFANVSSTQQECCGIEGSTQSPKQQDLSLVTESITVRMKAVQ